MPSLLPVLYELPERDSWRDKRLWPLVNPNFGRSVRGANNIKNETLRARKAVDEPTTHAPVHRPMSVELLRVKFPRKGGYAQNSWERREAVAPGSGGRKRHYAR
jgi:hypothetical protein